MEILQKYWWLGLGLIVLVYFASKSNSSGSLTQTRQGTDDVALAQIASSERENDEARKFGAAQSLLQYDLSIRGLGFNRDELQANTDLSKIALGQQLDLARISAETQATAQNSAYQLAALQASSNNYANQLQYQLSQYQVQRQGSQQTQQNWLAAISSGLQTFAPYLFGQATNNAGRNPWIIWN